MHGIRAALRAGRRGLLCQPTPKHVRCISIYSSLDVPDMCGPAGLALLLAMLHSSTYEMCAARIDWQPLPGTRPGGHGRWRL